MNYGDPWLIIELHDYVFSILARHTTACFNDNDE